jgi:hypothetical protein
MKNNVLKFRRPKKKMGKNIGKRFATAIFFILFAIGIYFVTNTSFDDLTAWGKTTWRDDR